ncbi:uncharacterized protein L3040_004719 [Drepanopeziza brunnea f. sp. 'multigermtubi']|uniref:RNA exonuclease 4 n=1 Tax=Marssonina brunnea f. sp. multigermtubi (strain MB_m1) TaxID=1072389 RepID=K1WZA9_MARBU|nr:RNA exonuclease 4 [Drepanopeziza brunnea f. sp. 'multigermtubi' MB_m1]EKD18326.1 RNA exonuclease 4 [Drepanopeziza brunnea f. sp. 'multigermtubi' MB_m1]KAJ5042162.1 hypothetical protein L3040_004719 [Drepanopeziza brunnea f. sp. 'multigermtubi']
MLALEKSESHRGKCCPNVLPCRINHNGAVNTAKRYWNPTSQPDGKRVAYFRGRKLHGKTLTLPENYRGVVVSTTERVLPQETPGGEEQGDEPEGEREEEPEVKILEEQSGFQEMVVWGHEVLPDGTADPYVRGVEEWIGFAEQIHSYDEVVKKS